MCSKGAELQELSDFLVSTQETMKTVKTVNLIWVTKTILKYLSSSLVGIFGLKTQQLFIIFCADPEVYSPR